MTVWGGVLSPGSVAKSEFPTFNSCFLSCSWLKDDVEVDLDKESDHYSMMGGNLVISNPVRNQHEGEYTCVATNTYGTVVSQRASVQFGCE